MWVYKDYTALYHHGILGMKWGVRRGSSLSDWRFKPLVFQKETERENHGKERCFKSNHQLRKFKSCKGRKSKRTGQRRQKYASSSNTTPTHQTTISNKAKLISQKTGLKLKTRTSSLQEDCKATAPGYSPNNPLARNNCGHCSMGYAMRRMGFDVEAKDMSRKEADGICTEDYKRYFKNFDAELMETGNHFTSNGYRKALSQKILSYCNKEDGALGMMYIGDGRSLGHFLSWENQNGEIKYVDPQLNEPNAKYIFDSMAQRRIYSGSLVGRLDNLEINTERIHEVVANRR